MHPGVDNYTRMLLILTKESNNMQTKQDIYKEVCKVLINKLGVREDQISPCSHIVDNFGADRLDCIEVIMDLEEQFGICIPDEDFDEFDASTDRLTVEKISDYICNRLGIH